MSFVTGSKADVHVLPIGDLKEHNEVRDCWCDPLVVIRYDEPAMVVHNAFDGRELIEAHGIN